MRPKPGTIVLAGLLIAATLLLWLVWPAEFRAHVHARLMRTPQLPVGYPNALYGKPVELRTSEIAELQATSIDPSSSDVFAAQDAKLELTQPADRVVLIGDSLTAGWGIHSGTIFEQAPYVNRGIGGNTSLSLLLRFQQDVVRLKPRAVVVMTGTNDVVGISGQHDAAWTEDHIRSMTDIALQNGIPVVLCAVPPMDHLPFTTTTPTPAMTRKLLEINAWTKRYSAERHLPYADFYSVMATPDGHMKPGISNDGVHANPAGYALMEPVLRAALGEVKPASAE